MRTASSLAALGVGDFGLHCGPAQVEQQRLGASNLSGNVAIARRLPRLGLERSDLRGELADDILGPGEIVLGGLEPQLRLVAARVQAGNAGRLFEHAAALVGPGLDDFADAALVDQSRRREPVEASANSTLTSRARTSRPLTRKVEPCSRMMRRDDFERVASLNAAGALRSPLSTMTLTSAWLRAGRPVLPEKITSSISDARMAL